MEEASAPTTMTPIEGGEMPLMSSRSTMQLLLLLPLSYYCWCCCHSILLAWCCCCAGLAPRRGQRGAA